MLAPELTLYLPDGSPTGLPLHLRLIPACPQGFLMGSRDGNSGEQPRHQVIIPRPFYLGTYPVTQAQFACFRPEHQNGFPGHLENPAESLDWYQARDFMIWLNTQAQNLPFGWEPRLPSEAEWEYACRAGTETEYWSGDGEAALREVGWYSGNSGYRTHLVGEKGKPNPWGLHDMHGNVGEWCADVRDSKSYAKRPDGWYASLWPLADAGEDAMFLENDDAAKEHPCRIVRGGYWLDPSGACKSTYRFLQLPRARLRTLGFRVLLALPGPVAEPQETAQQDGGRERAGGRDDRPGDGKAGAGLSELDALMKPKTKPA